MKNNFLKTILFSSAIVPIGAFVPIITSCANNINTPQLFNDSLNNQKYIDVYKFANEGSYNIHK
ncbi:MAG: hypothetical protein K2L64_01555, partial [Ureaplasma sp.]|nr:hypothetical protein [Ureaplasma sp.]